VSIIEEVYPTRRHKQLMHVLFREPLTLEEIESDIQFIVTNFAGVVRSEWFPPTEAVEVELARLVSEGFVALDAQRYALTTKGHQYLNDEFDRSQTPRRAFS
jgi:hypothetical protein